MYLHTYIYIVLYLSNLFIYILYTCIYVLYICIYIYREREYLSIYLSIYNIYIYRVISNNAFGSKYLDGKTMKFISIDV